MLPSLPSARITYAAAADASLLPTATNRVIQYTYWRNCTFVASCSAQRYSVWQINGKDMAFLTVTWK